MKNDPETTSRVKIGSVVQISRDIESPAAFKLAIVVKLHGWGVEATYYASGGVVEQVSPTWDKIELIGTAVYDHAGNKLQAPLAPMRHHP